MPKHKPGSDYTALSTVVNAVSLGIGAVVITMAGSFGYPTMLGASIALLGVGVMATTPLFTDHTGTADNRP